MVVPVAVAVPLLVGRVEPLQRLGRARGVDRAGRELHGHLPCLAEVAEVGQAHQSPGRLRHPLAGKRLGGPGLEPRQAPVDLRQIELRVALDRGLDVVVLEVDGEEAERGDRARGGRDQGRPEAQELDEAAGQERTGASERHQRVVARIEAALDAHLLDGVRLVPRRDLENALGRALGGEAELRGDGLDPLPGEIEGQRHLAAEEMRRDAAEDELGVSHRGPRAAAAVAHGARLRARARGSDLESSLGRAPGDRASSRPHRDEIDHRHLDGEAPDGAVGGESGLAALDQTDVGAGPARVQREDAIDPGGFGEEGGAERAGGRPAQDRRDRMAHDLAGGDDAAVRLHHLERHPGAELGVEPGLDPPDVAGDPALGEGVDQGRHRALVLPVLRPHLGGQRDVRLRMLAREHIPHPLLVRWVGVAVDEADTDGRDALLPAPARHLRRRRFVELSQDLPPVAHPLGNLADPVEGHDPLRLHPEVGVAVALGHALPRDLEHVAEPLGRHETESLEPLLEERIRRDRRAVRDGRDRVGRSAGEPEDLPEPLDDAERRVIWSGRRLGREHLARRLVHGDDVGERAARVDPDAEASPSLSHGVGCLVRLRFPECLAPL